MAAVERALNFARRQDGQVVSCADMVVYRSTARIEDAVLLHVVELDLVQAHDWLRTVRLPIIAARAMVPSRP
jgi:hypothetical protein